jgi:SNF2 family DNA or RNA helicase
MTETLHKYQQVGVEWLHEKEHAVLAWQMGRGKTATVLTALKPEHLPVLVVAPKRVAEHVWPEQSAKWRPDLSVALAAGTKQKRLRVLGTNPDIMVIGQDNLKDIKPGRFTTIVLDELSGYKNRQTVRWRTARKICTKASYVWGLTGTPAPNGLIDVWAQAFLIDQGDALGVNLTGYRSRYFRPGRQLPTGVIVEWVLRDGADNKIHDRLAPRWMSLESLESDLPEIAYNDVLLTLPPPIRKIYDQTATTLVADLRDKGGALHVAANSAVLTGKLSQITAGFLYGEHDVTDWLHDEKIKAVQEVVDGTGSPVLVFYRFIAERDAIREALPECQLIDEPGVIDRWNAGKVPVLLAHPASAGHGLNLQDGGHTIVWSSLPWSLEHWQQSNARLRRQGQQHPVMVHRVMADDTLDLAIRDRLDDKHDAQQALLLHLDRYAEQLTVSESLATLI